MYVQGWTIFGVAYIVLALAVFLRPDGETLARWMVAIPRPVSRRQRISWALNGHASIWWALTGSWLLIAVSFAVHYAGEFTIRGGFEFPGEPAPPRFTDFLYLAMQFSTTYAGSDVSVTTPRMRQVVMLHSVIAFLFNTVIIAVLVTVLLSTAG